MERITLRTRKVVSELACSLAATNAGWVVAEGNQVTIEELAQEVLDMLDAQRRYFGDRTRDNLIASKRLESTLKLKCEKIICPDLFSKESD
jgi:hypothetical protein